MFFLFLWSLDSLEMCAYLFLALVLVFFCDFDVCAPFSFVCVGAALYISYLQKRIRASMDSVACCGKKRSLHFHVFFCAVVIQHRPWCKWLCSAPQLFRASSAKVLRSKTEDSVGARPRPFLIPRIQSVEGLAARVTWRWNRANKSHETNPP